MLPGNALSFGGKTNVVSELQRENVSLERKVVIRLSAGKIMDTKVVLENASGPKDVNSPATTTPSKVTVVPEFA
jgi:hypothetical protein